MGLLIIDHVLVYFIGDSEAVVFTTKVCDLLKFVLGENLAEGIIRGIYDDRFCVLAEKASRSSVGS